MDFGTRLHRTPKEFKKKELTDFELTTVVSTLPPSTIQWIKSRRNFDSKSKVILSHYRESQLREIFTGLDVGKNGAIDLVELKDAVAYVGEKIHTTGLFRNISAIFKAMDENGDGSVDYQEFTNAMSGTTRSAFEHITEKDLENLHRAFIEYGVMKQREAAIAKIDEEPDRWFSSDPDRNPPPPLDYDKYLLFKSLFAEREDDPWIRVARMKSDAAEVERKRKADARVSSLVEKFRRDVAASSSSSSSSSSSVGTDEFLQFIHRVEFERNREAADRAKDPDQMIIRMRLDDAMDFATTLRPGKYTQSQVLSQLPPHAYDVDGRVIKNSLGALKPSLIPEQNVRDATMLRLVARQEMYDLMNNKRYQNNWAVAAHREKVKPTPHPPMDLRTSSDDSSCLRRALASGGSLESSRSEGSPDAAAASPHNNAQQSGSMLRPMSASARSSSSHSLRSHHSSSIRSKTASSSSSVSSSKQSQQLKVPSSLPRPGSYRITPHSSTLLATTASSSAASSSSTAGMGSRPNPPQSAGRFRTK